MGKGWHDVTSGEGSHSTWLAVVVEEGDDPLEAEEGDFRTVDPALDLAVYRAGSLGQTRQPVVAEAAAADQVRFLAHSSVVEVPGRDDEATCLKVPLGISVATSCGEVDAICVEVVRSRSSIQLRIE